MFFFCKQKTAYEMRISDWSSDVCSSDLWVGGRIETVSSCWICLPLRRQGSGIRRAARSGVVARRPRMDRHPVLHGPGGGAAVDRDAAAMLRSEEHTSELQSLMRISYAVFCLKKKKRRYLIPLYTLDR